MITIKCPVTEELLQPIWQGSPCPYDEILVLNTFFLLGKNQKAQKVRIQHGPQKSILCNSFLIVAINANNCVKNETPVKSAVYDFF